MNRKLIALTFDDGPNTGTMMKIMELLEQIYGKATFFVVGNCITEESAQVLKYAVRNGFEIGNHSMNHLHMSGMCAEDITREIDSVQNMVEQATGKKPVLFRPPYIDVDEKLLAAVPMPFIAGSGNYDWDPGCTVEQRVALALEAVEDGAILLMHCFEGNEATVEALRIILPELQRQGFEMVTVSRLFEEKNTALENGVMYERAG